MHPIDRAIEMGLAIADLGQHRWDAAEFEFAAVEADAGVNDLGRQDIVEHNAGDRQTAAEVLRRHQRLQRVIDRADAIGTDRIVFSLDLRDGQPVVANGVQLPTALSPEAIARTAASS